MTKQEKIIVSAYTGVLMCDFEDLCKYIEEKMQIPVFTHELVTESFSQKLRDKVKPEFIKLCEEGE